MVRGDKEKNREGYRKANNESNVSRKIKLGYPGLTIVLSISPTFPRYVLLHRHMGMQYTRMVGRYTVVNNEPRIAQFPLSTQVSFFFLMAFLQSPLSFSLPSPTIHFCLFHPHVSRKGWKIWGDEQRVQGSRVFSYCPEEATGQREETTEKLAKKETRALRANCPTLGISGNLSSTRSFASSRGDATDKDEWLEMAERKRKRRLPKRRQEKREETTEKVTKKDTRAVRGKSATLDSLFFSLDFLTFPQLILLHRHMENQQKRIVYN